MPEKLNRIKPGWQRVKFGDVVRQIKKKVDPEISGLERFIAGEHMNTDDLRIRRWGTIGDGYLGPAFNTHFKSGQVLYGSRRTYLRKVALADFEGICANTTFVLESKDSSMLLPDLLPFIMQTQAFNEHSVKQSKGSVNPYVNFADLAWFEFPLPPLKMQQQIAAQLIEVEEASNALEGISIAADQLCRSLMIDHFDAPHTEWVAVSNVGTWYSGGTPSRGTPLYWGGSIPWISPKEMKVKELDTTEEKLTKAGLETGLKLMPTDTIMIVVRGMILAHTFPVARTLVPAAFNQDMKALIVGEDFRPKYIQLWFEHAAPRYLQLVSESSHGTKRLESNKLFSLLVPKVSQKEQNQFVEKIESIRNAAMKADERRSEALKIKRLFLNENLI